MRGAVDGRGDDVGTAKKLSRNRLGLTIADGRTLRSLWRVTIKGAVKFADSYTPYGAALDHNGDRCADVLVGVRKGETLTLILLDGRDGSPVWKLPRSCNFQGAARVIKGVMQSTRDRDAEFKDFYMYEAPRLRRLALMLTGDADRASDLTQDALVKTYTSWGRIRGDDPAPYAKRVLVNLCRNAHRRRMVELRKTPVAPRDVVDRGDNVEEAMRVAAALSVLSPIRRAVVLLRFFEDMKESEIAQVLDRPLNTVKSDLRRALEKLRPMLEDDVRETR